MKGIELSRRYYEIYGIHLLTEEAIPYVSVGLVGNGSECFGFDDEISQDHDFQPGFCVWVDDDAPQSLYTSLQQAYQRLPREFNGYQLEELTAMGEQRRGVFRTSDFYRSIIGLSTVPKTIGEWLSLPDYALAAATNGILFSDHATDFTYIRHSLIHGMPRDIRLKRLAKQIALMAQAGQYNYSRCLNHGESGAARLALTEFVVATASVVYYFNNRYPPFYKWLLRGMTSFSILPDTQRLLSELLTTVNTAICAELIEELSTQVLLELKRRDLTNGRERYLDIHAHRIMKQIKNEAVRNLHVMA